jgi:hypothetical protein
VPVRRNPSPAMTHRVYDQPLSSSVLAVVRGSQPRAGPSASAQLRLY